MKKIKRVHDVTLTTTLNLSDLFLQEDEAFAMIEAIDLGQGESGFTTEVILRLIKSMKDEFKGFPEELEDFTKTITEALK